MTRLEKQAAARHAQRPRPHDRIGRLDRSPFEPPLIANLVCVETQVDGVVVQEALGVDVARELQVVAALQRRQELRPDLDIPLDAVQVDPFGLSRAAQSLADEGCAPAAAVRSAATPSEWSPDRPAWLVLRGHSSSS